MITILIVVLLVLLLVGGLPHWGHMAPYNYGYYPSGVVSLLLIILLILLIVGYV